MRKPFFLFFHGAFSEEGVWVITAHLHFYGRPESPVVEQARLGLIEGLIREGVRARSRGARRLQPKLDITAGVDRRVFDKTIRDVEPYM